MFLTSAPSDSYDQACLENLALGLSKEPIQRGLEKYPEGSIWFLKIQVMKPGRGGLS